MLYLLAAGRKNREIVGELVVVTRAVQTPVNTIDQKPEISRCSRVHVSAVCSGP